VKPYQDENYGRFGAGHRPLLRNDLILIDEVGFAPLDDTGAQLLRIVAAAYERALASPVIGRSSPGAGSCPSTPPLSACSTTGSCTTPASWSPPAIPAACAEPEPGKEPP